jgi:membrane protease YdiL (CAAX protease family)
VVLAVGAAAALWPGPWAAPVLALVMLLAPIALAGPRGAVPRFEPGREARSALEGLAAGAVLIPVFFLGIWLFWRFNSGDVTAGKVARQAGAQLFLVALPEEFFFRAFLQGGLERLARRKLALPGARVGWGLPAAAALFALAHLVAQGAPAALLVFFPGLVFGWLWARRASLAGPVIFHALCNLGLLWVAPGLFS